MAKRKQATAKVTTQRKKAKVEGGEDAPPKASLLGIPGEIRNRIYRHALIDKERVKLVQQNCEEPGLLQVCRQIREEARIIFQTENKFALIVHDFLAPTKPYWIWYSGVPLRSVYVNFCVGPIWNNLLAWLRLYHEGLAKWMKGVGMEDGPTHWVLNCFFRIVETLKDVPWEKVEDVLHEAKDVGWNPGSEQWIELDSDGEEMISAY